MHFTQRRNLLLTGLCLLTLGSLFSGEAAAAMPPGTIYFYRYNGDFMSMNGDGTGKKVVPVSIPSYQQHAGSRWSLGGGYVDGPLDPNGNPPWELFASNASGRQFQLTGDPDIVWNSWVDPVWGKDDSFVSFAGVSNTAAGVIGGLFVVPIDWSTGIPIAGAPTLLLETAVAAGSWWGWSEPNVYKHDWSPTGHEVVYEASNVSGVQQLRVASFSSQGVVTRDLTMGSIASHSPSWSLTGSRIAFHRSEIWTIKPDGTGSLKLTQYSLTKTDERRQSDPTWSPDGAYVAFTDVATKRSSGASTVSVQRIPAGGGSIVNLTSGIGNSAAAHWRP